MMVPDIWESSGMSYALLTDAVSFEQQVPGSQSVVAKPPLSSLAF